MAVVKLVNETYRSNNVTYHDSLEAVINYILFDKKSKRPRNYFGGIGVDPFCAAYQFRAIKSYFRKSEESRRQARHFVVSFETESTIDAYTASLIAVEIAKYYSPRYQIIYAVHENTENIHVHFVMNTVGYIDGRMYGDGYGDYYRLCSYVDKIVKKYV